ncbi:hypothetical protein [Nocardia sp. NPDC049149]|uniref:hypothetical protein n=1 Tax=Nocardia sp. NPDC049149 TaxID=3364315 RepID=UPI0037172C38
MPQPIPSQRFGARVERLPAPIPAAWAWRIRRHTDVEAWISRIQRRHYHFRDTVVWPGLHRLGVDEQLLDTARERHVRIFDPIYDAARIAHWYI